MGKATALNDPRLTLAGLFFETHDGLTHVLTQRLEQEFDIPRQSFEVLIRLARSPEQHLRMTDLAAQVTMSASGLSRAIDRLEGAGLVVREACATDRRTTYAGLTDLGREKVECVLPAHLQQLQDEFTGLLDTDERQALEQILRKLRDHVNPDAVRASSFPCGE